MRVGFFSKAFFISCLMVLMMLMGAPAMAQADEAIMAALTLALAEEGVTLETATAEQLRRAVTQLIQANTAQPAAITAAIVAAFSPRAPVITNAAVAAAPASAAAIVAAAVAAAPDRAAAIANAAVMAAPDRAAAIRQAARQANRPPVSDIFAAMGKEPPPRGNPPSPSKP